MNNYFTLTGHNSSSPKPRKKLGNIIKYVNEKIFIKLLDKYLVLKIKIFLGYCQEFDNNRCREFSKFLLSFGPLFNFTKQTKNFMYLNLFWCVRSCVSV